MDTSAISFTCPFCNHKDSDPAALVHHIDCDHVRRQQLQTRSRSTTDDEAPSSPSFYDAPSQRERDPSVAASSTSQIQVLYNAAQVDNNSHNTAITGVTSTSTTPDSSHANNGSTTTTSDNCIAIIPNPTPTNTNTLASFYDSDEDHSDDDDTDDDAFHGFRFDFGYTTCPHPNCTERLPEEHLKKHLKSHGSSNSNGNRKSSLIGFPARRAAAARTNSASTVGGSVRSSSSGKGTPLVGSRPQAQTQVLGAKQGAGQVKAQAAGPGVVFKGFWRSVRRPSNLGAASGGGSGAGNGNGAGNAVQVPWQQDRASSASSSARTSQSSLHRIMPRRSDQSRGEGQRKVKRGNTSQARNPELGPYAAEKRMPKNLYRLMKTEPRTTTTQRRDTGERTTTIDNQTPHIIPLLQRLSDLDHTVAHAAFCAPHVTHVFKMPGEGGFCGYRNIQMLISHVRDSRGKGFAGLKRVPSVLELQVLIEQAWDRGFNSNGRVETGGIKGTRKYIGTSEAQALFQSKGVGCEPDVFYSTPTRPAHEVLIDSLWEYFLASPSPSPSTSNKVLATSAPPLYLQHTGHSLTVVGIERRIDDSVNLVVLDPAFSTHPEVKALAGRKVLDCPKAEWLMRPYRRGPAYLSRFNAFEALRLCEV